MRDQFRAENPGMSFGELSKYTSHMYGQLTPEEKAAWQARADQDKQRFLAEMANYVPSPGYDNQGNPIVHYPPVSAAGGVGGPGGVGGRIVQKKQRDPMAPKRNLSAYLLYQNAMRDQFKADNPGMTFGQLSKYTSHMYKSLTASERAEWDERAKRDKERYQEEMKHYVPPHGFDCHGNLMVEYAAPRKNSKKAHKDPNMPKRARGSFVLFTKDERPKIQQENPQIKFTDLGAVLGKRWRALPEEERKKYDALAEQDKQRFAQEMEIYRSQNQMDHSGGGGGGNAAVGGAGYYVSHPDQSHQPPELYYNQQDKHGHGAGGNEMYHQDDGNHQYYLQDQQHLYQQQHGGVGVVHPSQIYQTAPPPLNVGHEENDQEYGQGEGDMHHGAYYAP
jgi:Chromatin-associated proteins containing the HMG domain